MPTNEELHPWCECDDSACQEQLPISWDLYREIGGGDTYLVIPGHVKTDYHDFEVVGDYSAAGYMVVKDKE